MKVSYLVIATLLVACAGSDTPSSTSTPRDGGATLDAAVLADSGTGPVALDLFNAERHSPELL